MPIRKFYRRRARKYIRRRTYRKKTVSPRIKKYVKNQIHRNIENKLHMNYAANQSVTTNDVNTMTWPLITSLGQSSDVSARVGNDIRVVKGIYRVCVNLLPYNETTNAFVNPYWVKCWVVKDLKNAGQLATMDSTAFSNFFRGNGVGLGFQSNTLDTTLDVNKDKFRVLYSKMFKLGTAGHTTGSDNSGGWFDNSPIAKHLTINWGKWCKKQLKFNDGTSYCQNDNLYFVIQCVPCNGGNNSGSTSIEMHYTNNMYYEDA